MSFLRDSWRSSTCRSYIYIFFILSPLSFLCERRSENWWWSNQGRGKSSSDYTRRGQRFWNRTYGPDNSTHWMTEVAEGSFGPSHLVFLPVVWLSRLVRRTVESFIYFIPLHDRRLDLWPLMRQLRRVAGDAGAVVLCCWSARVACHFASCLNHRESSRMKKLKKASNSKQAQPITLVVETSMTTAISSSVMTNGGTPSTQTREPAQSD